MPVENGTYKTLSDDQITAAIEGELQNEFGEDIDLTESSVFSTLAEVVGAVLSSNQEESIKEVYESAFLDTATGSDLERVVALLGLQRRDAVHATGVQRFTSSNKVTDDVTIQRGTRVQTGGTEPVEFETSEVTSLRLIGDFEGGSLSGFDGDVGNGTVVSSTAYNGSNSLQMDATDGAHIYDGSIQIGQGSVLHGHVRLSTGTVAINTFAVQNDASNYYQVAFDESANEVRLEVVESGSVSTTIDTTSVTLDPSVYYEAEITWNITDNIGVSVQNANGDELATLGGVDDTYLRGGAGFKSGDATDTKQFDFYTMSAASANLRAVDGGVEGNVGANTIEVVPSPPSGINSTTNLYAVGSEDNTDRNDNQFRVGRNEESDNELRTRAEQATTSGGSATQDAIVGNIINSVPDVSSVTLLENKTDNTVDGLPPHSFEVIVFGGGDRDVAEAIFDKKAITSRDIGGVNGTETTETIISDINGQEREISFSRPNAVNIDITLDVAINSNYVGDEEIADRIVEYIGGELSTNADTVGLGISENVIIDNIRDIVVGADDTGVIGFDQSVDGTPISTTPSTTVVDGLEVVEIGDLEVAQTSATDASITVNTREI